MEIIRRNIYKDYDYDFLLSFHARFVFVGSITFYFVVAKRFANFSDFIWYITHQIRSGIFRKEGFPLSYFSRVERVFTKGRSIERNV